MGATPFNETGHWELLAIYEAHRRLLASVDSDWDDWAPFPAGWFTSPAMGAYATELASIVQTEFGSSPLFIVKDPRACRLVPLWREVLAQVEAEFAPILAIRNPLEVAASLQQA